MINGSNFFQKNVELELYIFLFFFVYTAVKNRILKIDDSVDNE